jgi:hypothetical protein
MNPILDKLLAPVAANDHVWSFFQRTLMRVAQAGLEKRTEAVFKKRFADLVVRAGPFQGMQYPQLGHSAGSHFYPKILGTYEQEVYPYLEDALRAGIAEVVDVGCAEGYYAIGLALASPSSRVHAFDTDESAARMCGELARLNGVEERVTIGGWCDPAVLLSLDLPPRSLVIVDCEGYEKVLLSPEVVTRLMHCYFLVEAHDCYDPKISTTLLERFDKTHQITRIQSVAHKPGLEKREDLVGIPREVLRWMTYDRETPMEWLWCVPREQAGVRSDI